ncbi:MAG: hypothetical protein KDC33_05605 [Thermoleophilia bacterium]|nr:hypothetical protein [Thermoleophilia bacterium]
MANPVLRTRGARATVLSAVLACLLSPAWAQATDITPATRTTIAVDASTVPGGPGGGPVYWDWQKVTMRMTWAVPDGAAPGDTFSVALDPALSAGSFIPFSLKAPGGEVVANASLVDGRVVFTLTDYVRTHRDVKGDAFFALSVDTSHLNETTPSYLTVYGTRLTVNRDPGPSGRDSYKYAWWQPSEAQATARDANGVLLQRDRSHMRWAVQLQTQVATPARDWSRLTITETPSSGSHFNCVRVNGVYTGVNAAVDVQRADGPTPPNVAVTSCAPDRLVLTVTKPRTERGIYRVLFDGWLDVDAQGRPAYRDPQDNWHTGFNPEGFGNTAALNYDGWTTTVSTAFVRTAQGGNGQGVGVSPSVDIEKYSGGWAGVKFVDGRPVMDESGQPASLPAEDHDAAPGKRIDPANATTLTMTVTSTGSETLNNVTVVDDSPADEDLSGFACTYKGSTTPPFNGFAPGESFACTVTLRGDFGPEHEDIATVRAIGAGTGTVVSDADAFWAVRAPGAPATTPPATTPEVIRYPADTPTTSPVVPIAVPAGSPQLVSPPQRGTAISNAGANRPTLRVTKRAVARRVRAGAPARWQVMVRNAGGGVARRVRVCEAPDAGLTFTGRRVRVTVAGRPRTLSATTRGGRACVTVSRLAPGERLRWTVTTRVATGPRRVLRNTVTATADGVARAVATASAVRLPRPPTRRSPAVTG